jgi:hypothetical protein
MNRREFLRGEAGVIGGQRTEDGGQKTENR